MNFAEEIAQFAGFMVGNWLLRWVLPFLLFIFSGYALIGAGQCTYKSATGDKTLLVAPQIDPEFRR